METLRKYRKAGLWIFLLVVLFAESSHSEITVACDGECTPGPISLTFRQATECDGFAFGRPYFTGGLYNNSRMGECVDFGNTMSGMANCYPEYLETKSWYGLGCSYFLNRRSTVFNSNCVMRDENTYVMTLCDKSQIGANPIRQPTGQLPDANQPDLPSASGMPCPSTGCRSGHATNIQYNNRNCNGTGIVSEETQGQIGVCYKVGPYHSILYECTPTTLIMSNFDGTCDGVPYMVDYTDRRIGVCVDLGGGRSAGPIRCPNDSPSSEPLHPHSAISNTSHITPSLESTGRSPPALPNLFMAGFSVVCAMIAIYLL